jgi:hypothetical protein
VAITGIRLSAPDDQQNDRNDTFAHLACYAPGVANIPAAWFSGSRSFKRCAIPKLQSCSSHTTLPVMMLCCVQYFRQQT